MAFPITSILLFSFFSPLLSLSSDHCDLKTLPDPKTLRSDQLTILINGFSESRIPLLRLIASAYSSSPSVAAVIILWGNPNTPPQTLTQTLENNLQSFGAPITVLRQSTNSLNSRFLPQPLILTRAVAICDDDVEIDAESIEFAFKIWKNRRNSLVGFFARSHDLDLAKKTWIYTVHPDKYSIILTKFMVLERDYLYEYSCCNGSSGMREARELVDELGNCEDILMNLVVAEKIKEGPVLVEGKRVRDWGDGRNEGGEREEMMVRDAGLSTREKNQQHRKRRGDCIREFHRILGKMALRYSYGKVGGGIGEQGLCEKGGKLVFCDEQIIG